MVETNRKKVGVLFSFFREEWAGGFQFLVNLINSFNYIEKDSDKPLFYVFYNERSEKWLPQIDYPYKEEVFLFNYPGNLKTTVFSLLRNRNLFVQDIIEQHQLDFVYPVNDYIGRINNPRRIRMAAWIPDFQHKFYPQYFSFFNRMLREIRFKLLLYRASDLVQSSDDVVSHLNRFYKIPSSLSVSVLKFVSNVDGHTLNAGYLLSEYKIDRSFFIVSNQFFKHKNHRIVFEAINELRKTKPEVLVVFTGREDDYRNPDYIVELKKYISDNELHPNVRLLGLIPRKDQLGLMKQAMAVIQPSKFEGWSTVIEDAKSLGTYVIASNLAVHREQLAENASYFDENKPIELVKLMSQILGLKKSLVSNYQDYDTRVKEFAGQFLKIINGK